MWGWEWHEEGNTGIVEVMTNRNRGNGKLGNEARGGRVTDPR